MFLKHNILATQRGASLPTMIMFVVLIAVITAALVKITATASVSIGHEMMSTRSFMAAESGAQNAMAALFPLNGSPASCGVINVNFTTANLTGCTAQAVCSGPVSVSNKTLYRITSTGTCTAGGTVAVRTIEVGARAIN